MKLSTPTIGNVVRISGFIAGLACTAVAVPVQAQLYFSPAERDAVQAYWNTPGRYEVLPLPDVQANGAWRVRQTADGSKWIWAYNRSIRPEKINPSIDPKAANATQAKWDAWIDKRVAYDYWVAEKRAHELNAKDRGAAPNFREKQPPAPGQMPADLKKLAGAPPVFADAFKPRQHAINFEDRRIAYEDNVLIRPKYAYFRFHEGVRSSGERVREMSASELSSLFSAAGISDSEMRVMKSVSLLEGGFDSVNTYDTGFVSVGFIQFAALSAGGGSLGQVLLRMKQRWPQAFDANFRKYGLEVTDQGLLVSLCPTTGAEFIGADAAQKIITDKRLIAVYQHAGQVSREFRLAQLQIAKEMYYPAEDTIKVKTAQGAYKTCQVKDIFRTEAGMATMMDRKVNTGKLGNLAELASGYMVELGLNDPRELAGLEYEFVRQLKYRKDYLTDANLSRPRADTSLASRAGKRSGRGG